ncbi:hypothetical protein C0583_05680 [Candidatus Parcubacteria bacterium]|nr:MAG: hypothetical protein C0583_05680 [Candidatus Parcubacteria bacterium]
MKIYIDEEFGFASYGVEFKGNKKDLINAWEKGELSFMGKVCCGVCVVKEESVKKLETVEEDNYYYENAEAFIWIEGMRDCLKVDDKFYFLEE